MSRPLLIGHRGWPGRFPDNTLAAFLAVSVVADMVELDVRRSGDGKLILAHDPSLGGLSVHATAWSELAELDLGDGHHPALLDEVLAAIPALPAQLEIKNAPGDPGYEPDHRLALEVADRARNGDIVTSFNPSTIEAVRRDFNHVSTGLAVEFPESIEDVVQYCQDAGHAALVPAAGLAGIWIADARGEGLEIFPWTVNDPHIAAELVDLGVSGIITDDPEAIGPVIRGET